MQLEALGQCIPPPRHVLLVSRYGSGSRSVSGSVIRIAAKILIICSLVYCHHHHNRFTAFFRDHPGEPAPEENFWTLWCKGRLTEADSHTDHLAGRHSIQTSQCPPPPSPISFFYRPNAFPPPNQQCQSTENFMQIYSENFCAKLIIDKPTNNDENNLLGGDRPNYF